jgi:hypothetical protein
MIPAAPKDKNMSMKTLFGCIIGVALTAGVSFGLTGTSARWNLFTSSNGFVVKYPATWFRKGASKDRLLILSSKGGAEAIIIKKGQAMISVVEASRGVGSSLSRLIDQYSHDVDVVSRRTVLDEHNDHRGCRELKEVVSREAAVPPEDVPGPVPYIVNTEFFCEVNGRTYVTVLRNFQDDTNQGYYQGVALKIAESLRVVK